METFTTEDWDRLFAGCASTAWRLKTRDVYASASEAEEFAVWRAGRHTRDRDERKRKVWLDRIRAAKKRGVETRCALLVSEPANDYMLFEYDSLFADVAAGQDVRWLPRPRSAEITVPGTDFWIFDGKTVVFSHYGGDGVPVGETVAVDLAVAKVCATSFEAVWRAATPHRDYSAEGPTADTDAGAGAGAGTGGSLSAA